MMLQRPPNRDRTREFAAVADRVRKTMGASASADDRTSTVGAEGAKTAAGGRERERFRQGALDRLFERERATKDDAATTRADERFEDARLTTNA